MLNRPFQPREVLCGAADEVLHVLKSEDVRETEKKKSIESSSVPYSNRSLFSFSAVSLSVVPSHKESSFQAL